jgi:hypothetical protein
MKYVQAILTADGKLHACENTAKQHARRRYDDAMTEIRRALTAYIGSAQEAYKAALWIEQNFSAIAHCTALYDDINVENVEGE